MTTPLIFSAGAASHFCSVLYHVALNMDMIGWLLMLFIPFCGGLASSKAPSNSQRFLDLLSVANNENRAVPLVGVHDVLSAKIMEQQGAPALFVSGFGVSASRLGEPDAGILTRSEMEDTAWHIISACSIPVVVDGDTGFGGASNLRKLICNLAKMGAAAVSIEDQKFPKRCTYVAGQSVNVVSRQEATKRIQTALRAKEEAFERDGNSIAVIARTDCRMAMGLEEAITRCKIFEELGADIVYAENLQSEDEYMALRESLRDDTSLMLAQVQTGNNDNRVLSTSEIGSMGYSLALFGVTPLQATVAILQKTATDLFANGGLVSSDTLASLEDVKRVVGFPELDEFEQNYGCT